jgi:hypothetical protein
VCGADHLIQIPLCAVSAMLDCRRPRSISDAPRRPNYWKRLTAFEPLRSPRRGDRPHTPHQQRQGTYAHAPAAVMNVSGAAVNK